MTDKTTGEENRDEVFDYEEIIAEAPDDDNEDDFNYVTSDAGEYEPVEDYEEDDDDEYEDEEDDYGKDDMVFPFRPWMIPALAGLMVLAILICIPLWKLSHRDSGANDKILAAVTETQKNETVAQEASVAVEDTPAATDTVTESAESAEPVPETTTEPTAEPQATPEAQATAEPQPTEAPVPTEAPYISGDSSMTFEAVNESVTAKDVTNLRTSPNTTDSSNVVGKLRNGEVLTRTGQNGDTGWSRLEYNGQTVYAVSSYLVTDLSYTTPVTPTDNNRFLTQDGRVIVFTDCDDYITPKELINLRTEPSTSEGDSTVRTQVRNGTSLHRTGYSETSGWSRVEYNGEILYAVTNYVISGSAPE